MFYGVEKPLPNLQILILGNGIRGGKYVFG